MNPTAAGLEPTLGLLVVDKRFRNQMELLLNYWTEHTVAL